MLMMHSNLRKIRILLSALERAQKPVEYYALDLSLIELRRTLSEIPKGTFKYVQCFGLHGTYDDGLLWLQSPTIAARPKTVMTLGSSIGNFKRHEAPVFLRGFSAVLKTGDTILIGIDACKDSEKVFHAYNDKHGITHQFILNGLAHANHLLGHEAFQLDQWVVVGEYDKVVGRHHAFVSPIQDVTIDGVRILANEKVRIEESYKYSVLDTSRLFDAAGLIEGAKWSNELGDYGSYFFFQCTLPRVSLQYMSYLKSPLSTCSCSQSK
jgi:EasF-like predicted methyltransferase